MLDSAVSAEPAPRGCVVRLPSGGAIDCDVHPALPGTGALLPYLDDYWREQIVTRGLDGFDSSSFPLGAPANCRPDWRPPDGKPGQSFELFKAQALDAFGSRFAICNCLYGAHAIVNPELGAALARAINDWMAREWLDRDPRLRASIVVPTQAPELAAAEIERWADDKRFVQVLVYAMGEIPLGRRLHWPIFEAAERNHLPIGIHAGSAYRHPPSWNGWPSYYMEDIFLQSHAAEAQLLSLMAGGVFQRFPDLTIVLMETGFSWLPEFLWRSLKTWRALRSEVPWLDRPPTEIIRERVKVTLQPTDAPPDPAQMTRVIEMINSDEMFLFSTDYPHWHFNEDFALPAGLPPQLLDKLLVGNAMKTFPRLTEVGR